MTIYEKILNDNEIRSLIAKIDKEQVKTLPSDHGTKHITFCVNFVEEFLTDLKCDLHTVELGKIAALLHDIGCVHGKQNHAQNSVTFTRDYFKRIGFNKESAEIILDAIANHSSGKELNSIVSAALVLADKCHWTRDRFHKKSDLKDIVHKCIKTIEKIEATITDQKLLLTYHVERL